MRQPLRAAQLTGLALAAFLLAGCDFPSSGEATAERVDPSSTVDYPNPLAADPRFAEEPLTEEQLKAMCEVITQELRNAGHENIESDPKAVDSCLVSGAVVDGVAMFMSISRGSTFSEHDAEELITQDPPPTECELEKAFHWSDEPFPAWEPKETAQGQGYCYLVDLEHPGYSDAIFYSHAERYDVKVLVSEELDEDSQYPPYNLAYTDQLMPIVFAALP